MNELEPPIIHITLPSAKLLAYLLELAGDKFSNHGCNDFDFRDVPGLTDAEAKEFKKKYDAWLREDYPEHEGTEDYTEDYLLMRFFESRLKEHIHTVEEWKAIV
jgi:hypothetical protein